jgi:hypothetical protein
VGHTVETSRPRLGVPLGPAGREQEIKGHAPHVQRIDGGSSRVASAGVVLRWAPSIPMPRGHHSRPVPVRPPDVWCVDQERGIARGSCVFLLHAGQAPGLVARGVVSRAPFLAAREDRIGTVGQHIGVEWQELHALTTRVPLDVLVAAVPDWLWLPDQGAAAVLPPDLVECLERVWTQWHHRPQRGHRVAEWVRESLAEATSSTTSHSGAGARHRRLAAAGHGLHLEVRTAV